MAHDRSVQALKAQIRMMQLNTSTSTACLVMAIIYPPKSTNPLTNCRKHKNKINARERISDNFGDTRQRILVLTFLPNTLNKFESNR